MNPQLNKKVKKYLDSYFRDTKKNSPEHQEAVMLVMRGALTDANFHSEAKELGKYFPKASKKYIGTPMEGVIEDKGIDIAKMAKWDGHDIIDAFAFYLSMSIGGSFGNKLMSLKESLEESLVSEGERLDEKNCPTDASKWSYYKSQAKKKFDVYPSAYANGWASKQYKSAGGGWKACKKESIDEKMVTPKRGHNYYQLYRDTPIKYVSGHSGIGLKVPGVLLHNEYDTIKGKEGAYIIDYFGAHFYVDMKNKFASRIAHPDNREQNKDLRKNMGRTALAPEHKDWKKYMNESVNEGISVFDERHFGKNGLIIMIDDNGKKVSAIFKNKKNSYKYDRNNPAHIKKLLQLAKSKKFPQTIDESVNEGKYNYKEDAMNAYMKGKITAKELDQIAKKDFGSSVATKKELQSFLDSGYMKSLMADTYGLKVPAMEKKVKELMRFAESVNEAKAFVVMYKVKKDLPNRNVKPSSAAYGKEADAKKFLKSIEKDGGRGMIVKSNVSGMKVESPLKEYKHKFGKHNIQFQVSARPNDGSIVLIAKTSNDLDSLQTAIADDSFDKADLAKSLEKKLRIPIEVDYGWKGAGYAFKIDLYSLVKMVK